MARQWFPRRPGTVPAAHGVDTGRPDPGAEAATLPRRRSLPARLALAGLLLLLPLLLLAAALGWVLGSTAGARTLLGWVPGLSATGVQGVLAGDFQVDRLRWRLGSRRVLHIDGLAWQGLALSWPREAAPQLQVARLRADRVDLQGPSDDPNPIQLPNTLVLPLAVQVASVQIDTLQFDAIRPQPVQGITGRLHLQAGPLARHRLDGLHLRWDRLQAEGDATLEAAAPLQLQAALRLQPLASAAPGPARDWSASLAAQGPLARLAVTAELRGQGQSLQAAAEVEPVATQPISRLQARFEALDLAALASGWPQTALSGQIVATLDAEAAGRAAAPLGVEARLDNHLPGRLDARRLPLRRLQLSARGNLHAVDQGRIEALQLTLANGQDGAGEVRAEGHWALIGQGSTRRIELAVQARLQALQPARLHQAAPALDIGGPLALNLAWPLAPGGGTAEPTRTPDLGPPGARLGLQTELRGHLVDTGLPAVRLRVNLDATPQGLTLDNLLAESGNARLESTGQLQREGPGWRIRLDSALQDFDPLPWWPGAAQHRLGRGPHRLAGQAQVNLHWPDRRPAAPPTAGTPASPAAEAGAVLADLAALRGEARLTLGASLLAGVPVTGQLRLASSQAQPALGPLSHLVADLALQANPAGSAASELQLHADLDPNHGQDHWSARWSSPALDSLAAWWRLIDPAQPPLLAGDTSGQLTLDGRWPRLRSQGELSAGSRQALRWWADTRGPANAANAPPPADRPPPLLQLQGLQAQWQAGSGADDRLQFEVRVDQAQGGGLQLQAVDLQGQGRGAAHVFNGRFDLLRQPAAAAPGSVAGSGSNNSAETPASGAVGSPAAPLAARRVQARWLAEGGLNLDLVGRRGSWAGRITQGSVHDVMAASEGRPASNAVLLNLAATSLRLSHSPLSTLFQVEPTRLALSDAWLRLDELTWREERPLQDGGSAAPGTQRSLTLRAELEPLAVAPLLARAQPGFGWAGDLQVGAHIQVLATPQHFSAEAEIRRVRGDLLVVDPDNPAGPQRLGLADLRLAASAREGQWRLTQHIAGGNLGSLDGEQSVQAPPAAFWPPPEAPLAGRIDLRIAQLGHWGRWLPAGWRLSGQLDTHATLAGRFGGPELSGELVGQGLAVRNVLQGVDWREASVRVALAGDTAGIRQFHVKAGAGQLNATGQIRLGSTPSLSAQIQADHFAALQRVDRRIVASGQAELQVDARSTALKGRLLIDEGRFDFSQRDAPGLADDVTVARSQPEDAPADAGAAAARGAQRNTQLDLRVDLGKQLHLQGRGLSTRLTGELRLTTPANKLALQGDVHAVDGSYTAYGQKLGIDRGIILFAGVADNPRLDIEATKPDLEDLRVGVAITGTAQSPRVRLFSDPEMTETDKLSYLLLGRASDGLGRTDLALLQRAAFALITGEDDSPSLIERIGLDQLSVRKEDGDTRETVVSLGKQLSRRWYLGYERSLNAASGTWQLIYRAAQRFTLRAQTGTENALDLIWTWKWGSTSLLPVPLPGAAPSAGRAASQPAERAPP